MKIEKIESIQSDFIYNDFPIIYPQGNNSCLRLSAEDSVWELQVHLDGENAYVGTWLREIPEQVFCRFCAEIFRKYVSVKRICFRNYPVELKKMRWCDCSQNNHWRVDFPETPEQLDSRLSSQKRNQIKRKKRIVEESVGAYFIEEYEADQVPRYIVDDYFDYKKKTYDIDYHMSAEEYLHCFHVSHVYVLRFDELIGAIVCSCEQDDYVYLENLTYNPEYSKYSLGAILYDEFLKRLVQKRKSGIYLGYGNHRYKSMYGAIEQQVFNGKIYRSGWLYFREVIWPRVRRKARSGLRRIAGMLGILHVRSILKHSGNNESENQGEIK